MDSDSEVSIDACEKVLRGKNECRTNSTVNVIDFGISYVEINIASNPHEIIKIEFSWQPSR